MRSSDITDHSVEMKSIFEDLSKSLGEDWEVKLLAGVKAITAPPCAKMLQQIGLDDTRTEPFDLLDHACGPGVTAGEVQRMVRQDVLRKSSILSADTSAQMVEACRRRAAKENWQGKCDAKVIDAQNSGLPTRSFSHVTMNLGFHVIPDAEAALTGSRVSEKKAVVTANRL